MTIYLFAILKEYFPAKITVLDSPFKSIAEVKDHLKQLNPQSEKILDSCRYAINNELVELNYLIESSVEIAVIPPSSGG